MDDPPPDPDRIALGVRQPWAELILRGIKTIEVRSQDTNVRGPIYLYAAKRVSDHPTACHAVQKHRLDAVSLPLGVLVGSVEIHETRRAQPADAERACVPAEALNGYYAWSLRNPVRLARPLPVRFVPYGIWFYPFKRRFPGRRRTRSR